MATWPPTNHQDVVDRINSFNSVVSLGKSVILRKSADQTMASGNWEAVTWDVEDNDSLVAHDTATNTARITAPVTGVYFVESHVVTDSGLYTKIRKNGTTIVSPQTSNRAAPVGNVGFSQCVTYLAAGDYVEVMGYKASSYTVYANNGGELPSSATMTLLYDASGAGTIGAPAQRVRLAELTTTATQATIDFQNISQQYDDLEIEISGRANNAALEAGLLLYLNNDTATTLYTGDRILSQGNTAYPNSGLQYQIGYVSGGNAPAGEFGTALIKIPDYAGATKVKAYRTLSGSANDASFSNNVWNSTAAVSRVTLAVGSGSFVAGTRVRVYGFKDVTEAQSGAGLLADTAWHYVGAAGEPAFQNSWVNFGAGYMDAAFRRDSDGYVHMRGMVKSGAVGTTVFTLPVGYRVLGGKQLFSVLNTATAGVSAPSASIIVDVDGTVKWGSGPAGGYLNLSDVPAFLAEA